ncbi:ABC transporter substrate-binding protein [Paenibacillus sp. Marseille-Q4541]|uniref:ABC transporter substrate-binding protein n=1 Tax=Paenibacillus sp. Marseille-Q4541 TaxID=2831522 RepID=UPI00201A0F1D|nr:ABC transporter substrate-binding protein [Paenibacillus sp. Marseille-Q4541]
MIMNQSLNQKKRKNLLSRKLFLVGFLFSLLLLQACSNAGGEGTGAQPTSKAELTGAEGNVKAVLNYGYIGTNDLNLPGGAEGWGLHKGIIQEELKKHGITEVKLTGFPNGPDLTESLISGRLDLGSLGDTPAIIAYASGAKTRLITQGSTNSIGYLIGKKGGPQSLSELKGKTIAIQKGSFMHRYVVGLLNEAGVTDVKLVHMLIPDAKAALARGDVDAMTNNANQGALEQIEDGFIHLDDASKHPDLRGSSATVASEEYLASFSDFPKVWNEAREKALADLKQHEEEYYEFIAKLQGQSVDVVKITNPISEIKKEPFTDEGLKLLDGTKNFLVDENLAKKNFEMNDWVLK